MINTLLQHLPTKMEVKDIEDETENLQNNKVVEESKIQDNKIAPKADVEEKYKNDAEEDEENEKSDTETDILEIKLEDTLLISSDFCLDINKKVEKTTETVEIIKNLETFKNLENCKNLKTNESLQTNRNNKNSENNQNLENLFKSPKPINKSTCSVVADSAKTDYCGNIYVSKLQQKLIFSCELCNLKYSDLDNLGRHLYQEHKIFHFDDDPKPENTSRNLRKSNRLPNKRQKKDTLHESLTSAPPVALSLTSFAELLDCCGNVFIVKQRTLFMACGYCDWQHANFNLFEKHLRQQHHLYEEYRNELNVVPKMEVVEEVFIITEVEANISSKRPKRNTRQAKEPKTSTERIKTTETYEKAETVKSDKETTKFPEPTKSLIETVIPTEFIKQKTARRSAAKGKSTTINNKKQKEEACAFTETKIEPEFTTATIAEAGPKISIKTPTSKPAKRTRSSIKIKAEKETDPAEDDQSYGEQTHKEDISKEEFPIQAVHTDQIRPFECDKCGKHFRTHTTLKQHKLRHTNVKKFKCVICEFAGSSKQDLNLHMRHHMKDGRFQCSMCPKTFLHCCDLKIHLRVHTGEKPFVCDICNKCFRASQNLSVHKKSHMGEASKTYKCEYCAKKFMRNVDRKIHMRTHTGERPYKCEICQRGFSSKLNVRGHIERDHTSKPIQHMSATGLEPPPPARERKKPGPKPKALIKEELSKQKEVIRDLQQKLMQQNKSDEKIIDTEEDMHLLECPQDSGSDRRYHCSKCPKAFVRNSDLKIHKRIHTGEKPYVCDICNKCFRANQNLNMHKKIHMGEASKTYNCEHCDKKFMRNIDRKIHMRSHTGEKPFKCDICERGYSSKVHVLAHIERDHVLGISLATPSSRGRKKLGTKPKALREKLAKQKKLIDELKQQLL